MAKDKMSGDTWDLIDMVREQGWCLDLDNRGLGDRIWTAVFTNWGRFPGKGCRVEANHVKPRDAIALAVAKIAEGREG